jgi:hypothetical protein
MGLNIPSYMRFCGNGTNRPGAHIPLRNMNIWMLPGFSSRDPVTVFIKYNKGEVDTSFVVCSAYLPFDSEVPPINRV